MINRAPSGPKFSMVHHSLEEASCTSDHPLAEGKPSSKRASTLSRMHGLEDKPGTIAVQHSSQALWYSTIISQLLHDLRLVLLLPISRHSMTYVRVTVWCNCTGSLTTIMRNGRLQLYRATFLLIGVPFIFPSLEVPFHVFLLPIYEEALTAIMRNGRLQLY